MFSFLLHLKIQFVRYFCVYLTKLNTFDICSTEAWEWVEKGWGIEASFQSRPAKEKKKSTKSHLNLSTHFLTLLIYCTFSASMLKLSLFLNFSPKKCGGTPFAPAFQSRGTHPHFPPIKVAERGRGSYTCPFAPPPLLSHSSTILFVGERNCFLDSYVNSF